MQSVRRKHLFQRRAVATPKGQAEKFQAIFKYHNVRDKGRAQGPHGTVMPEKKYPVAYVTKEGLYSF